MSMFKKTTLALAISALAGGALAQSAPAPAPAPAPQQAQLPPTLLWSMTIVIAVSANQTYKPAIQGGFDYAHESGFILVTGTRVLVGLVILQSMLQELQIAKRYPSVSAPVGNGFLCWI